MNNASKNIQNKFKIMNAIYVIKILKPIHKCKYQNANMFMIKNAFQNGLKFDQHVLFAPEVSEKI